jgi:hypothetical protein
MVEKLISTFLMHLHTLSFPEKEKLFYGGGECHLSVCLFVWTDVRFVTA